MAYRNLETGRIYLNMAQAPICKALAEGTMENICRVCPIMILAKKHGVLDRLQFHESLCKSDDLGCADIAKIYGDEVAVSFGYEKIILDDIQEAIRWNSSDV